MANAETTRSQPGTSTDNARKWKKRPHTPIFNGIGSYEDKNSDYLCPICFEIISEAHMTKCGHTFCYDCIITSLQHSNRCPKCNFAIDSADEVFPNFLLDELIMKQKKSLSEKRMKYAKSDNTSVSELQNFITSEKANLTIQDVNNMLDILAKKKHQLEIDCKEAQILLLQEFLQKVRAHKQEEMKLLQQHINVIDSDACYVEQLIQKVSSKNNRNLDNLNSFEKSEKSQPSTSHIHNLSHTTNSSSQDCFNGSKYGPKNSNILSTRRKRMHSHFDELEQSYLNMRSKDLAFSTYGLDSCSKSDKSSRSGLEEFNKDLLKFTKFSSLRPLATLNYCNDHFNSSSIVSSIEFDKDNEFFGIAGVIKKIKLYEYGAVIRDTIDIHYPINEMVCTSKISCISWSSYHKSMLASSDYEGTVTLWDAFTGQKRKSYQEHEKRCWSVDFNRVDTKLIASGSDDAKVKIWSTALEHSVTSLETKANVCCVKFNPESRFHLAFGSADHCVHYYDLRNPKQPLEVFKGHRKAVSYVKFLNGTEVVSASTDSHLKLWNVNQSHCVRSFRGHINEKNFVGLATDGDFITCGSENNALYIYYKSLPSQVLTFRFDPSRNILDKERKEDDTNDFVSAVCWRMGSNVVVAANSQGSIKVLELI